MTKYVVLLFCMISLEVFSQSVEVPEKMCDVYGKIYYTYTEADADYKVFIEKADALADYIVYKEENSSMATASGFWYEVYDISYADYKIFITKDRYAADFTIYVVDVRQEAGCKKDQE